MEGEPLRQRHRKLLDELRDSDILDDEEQDAELKARAQKSERTFYITIQTVGSLLLLYMLYFALSHGTHYIWLLFNVSLLLAANFTRSLPGLMGTQRWKLPYTLCIIVKIVQVLLRIYYDFGSGTKVSSLTEKHAIFIMMLIDSAVIFYSVGQQLQVQSQRQFEKEMTIIQRSRYPLAPA